MTPLERIVLRVEEIIPPSETCPCEDCTSIRYLKRKLKLACEMAEAIRDYPVPSEVDAALAAFLAPDSSTATSSQQQEEKTQ